MIESVPDNFDINSVLDLEFSNFTVVGSPNFIPVDGNSDHLQLAFEIERSDYSKNWANTQNTFRGSLELKKIREGKEVKLVVTHSANETKYVAGKVTSGIVKHFKEKGNVDVREEVKKITFDDFNNIGRIHYFLSLTKKISSSLVTFEDIVNVGLAPDTGNSLPEEMRWMEKSIEDLRMNGKGLQNTIFVKNKALHPYVYMHQVLARYKFDHKGLIGTCVVSIGFPEFGSKKEFGSELEVNVKSVSFDQTQKYITRDEMIKIVLSDFDTEKLANFDKLDSKYLA